MNMKNIEVMGLKDLCSELNIQYSILKSPRYALNRVITLLSDKYRDTDIVTLLLVDEVYPCYDDQTIPVTR